MGTYNPLLFPLCFSFEREPKMQIIICFNDIDRYGEKYTSIFVSPGISIYETDINFVRVITNNIKHKKRTKSFKQKYIDGYILKNNTKFKNVKRTKSTHWYINRVYK